MITTITLNPAIDKTILLPVLDRGSVNRITDFREDIGGKGINVAKILYHLQASACACGFIGQKNRQKVEELLMQEGLTHHFLETEGVTRTNTKIVELDKGMTTDLNEQGFYVEPILWESLKALILEKAAESDYMVFSGSVPQGLTEKTYRELIELVRDQTLTVLDADGLLLAEGITAGPFMIKPNIHELETAFEVKLYTEQEIISLCHRIQAQYRIQIILVSMGADGSLLVTEKECYRAEPIPVEVKSTVGAGDSMLGGMLYGIDKGLPAGEAFRYAVACGTLAVTQTGTQSFSMDEVQDMMKHVRINKCK